MKRIGLFVILILSAASALGQEIQPVQAHVLSATEIAFKPSLSEVLGVLARSGVSSASTNVLLAYDETGKVIAVKLDHTTGSKALDAAVLGWAAKIRLDPQQAGIGSLPISFDSR
jgi:hypothetical protein